MKKIKTQVFIYVIITLLLVGCSVNDGSSIIESQTSVLSEPKQQVARPEEIPLPSVTELAADYYASSLEYVDEEGESHVINPPIEGGQDFFVSTERIAVVGIEENLVYGTTSSDRGANWIKFDISIEFEFVVGGVKLGFTSPSDGWIICYSELSNEKIEEYDTQYILFQTFDGGITWENKAVFSLENGGSDFSFASPTVGWVNASHANDETHIYETYDAGKTWVSVPVMVSSEILEGVKTLQTASPVVQDKQWVLSIFVYRNMGYASGCEYNFIWNELSQAWQCKEPEWNLPSGVDVLMFRDYVQSYLYPPETYPSDETTIYIDSVLGDAAGHLARVKGMDTYFGLVSFETIDRLANCLYSGAEYDSKVAAEAWHALDPGGVDLQDNGIIFNGRWPKSEGEPVLQILFAHALENGDIEATLKRIYYPGPGEALLDRVNPKTLYQRCVFRPTELDGIPYFTLLSATQIDTPLTN